MPLASGLNEYVQRSERQSTIQQPRATDALHNTIQHRYQEAQKLKLTRADILASRRLGTELVKDQQDSRDQLPIATEVDRQVERGATQHNAIVVESNEASSSEDGEDYDDDDFGGAPGGMNRKHELPASGHHYDTIPIARVVTTTSYPSTTDGGSRSASPLGAVRNLDADQSQPCHGTVLTASHQPPNHDSFTSSFLVPTHRDADHEFIFSSIRKPNHPSRVENKARDMSSAPAVVIAKTTGHTPPATDLRPVASTVAQQRFPTDGTSKAGAFADESSPESASSPESWDEPYYTREELSKMSFEALANEPIDRPTAEPAAQTPPAPDPEPESDLDTLMRRALAASDNDSVTGERHRILHSLPLEQWEAAGEWLLARMSSTMARMVSLRREKRELARGLERDIAGRNDALRCKRRALEGGLERMRRDCGRIVRAGGTPVRKDMD